MAFILAAVFSTVHAPRRKCVARIAGLYGVEFRERRKRRNTVPRNPGVTPAINKNGLPEGKPLICLVAGGRNGYQQYRKDNGLQREFGSGYAIAALAYISYAENDVNDAFIGKSHNVTPVHGSETSYEAPTGAVPGGGYQRNPAEPYIGRGRSNLGLTGLVGSALISLPAPCSATRTS
jgi:hypothetical protein